MRLGKRKDGGVRAILLAPTKELATQSMRILYSVERWIKVSAFFGIANFKGMLVEVRKIESL